MEPWREDQLNALSSAESENDLFGRVAAIAARMGFEYCAYGIQMPVPISRPAVAMFSNYSRAWQECYQTRGYLQVDPTVRHGLKSNLPVIWSDTLFEACPNLWEEARAHGLHYGWAQAARDSWGSVGLLTMARGGGRLSAAEMCANLTKMAWLLQFVHAAMSRMLLPKLVPEARVMMTAREREVLRWTAEGKTAYEISRILTVSERTVNFHINNVVNKLGATNKTQAAVKAAALGLLF